MKKIKITALLLTMCIAMAGCQKSENIVEQQQQLKQEGMELQMAGDYSGAIAKYEEALRLADMKVTDAEIDLAYYKASAQYRSGDLTGAIDTYSAVLAIREDEEGWLGRGLLYVEAKEAKKAEDDLNRVLKETEDPLIKGIVYNIVNQDEKAKEYFEQAKSEGNAEAIFYLANCYEKAGDHNYAMILMEEYLATGKAGAEGYLSVGRQYFTDGNYEEALEIFREGIDLGESGLQKEMLQEEIACLEKLGDFEGAREKAAVYLENNPEDALIQKEYEFLKSR